MQMTIFACCFLLGIVLCVVLASAMTVRWRLPFSQALVYFGLAQHPEDLRLRRYRA